MASAVFRQLHQELRMTSSLLKAALLALGLASTPALGQSLVILDPARDDKGPGTYVYPADPVHVAGAFDLIRFEMTPGDDYVDFAVTVAADISNPWRLPHGFSLQFPIVFIAAAEVGHQEAVPGMNVSFDMLGWDKAILMSPQEPSFVRREIGRKAPDLADSLVVPSRIRAEGRTITARVPRSALPDADPGEWAVQVVMQRNDGYAASGSLMMTAVNESEGQHRFGGGRDGDCDPHVIDMLAPEGQDQYAALKDHACGPDGEPERMAVLPMILPGS
jgi:carbohydrate-binding DOMON domain-containing protein